MKTPTKMKIDQFPVEILIKIFSYLPSYDKVCLVNKQFYNVACKINDSKIRLSLHWCLFEKKNKLQLLQSIKKTHRKITKLSVYFVRPTESHVREAISVIKKFSASIKYLRFESYFLEISDFLEVLSLVPNVEHLVFKSLSTERTGIKPPLKKRRTMPSNGDLNLLHLKTLNIKHCKAEYLVVFNRLPPGVLKELYFDNLNLADLSVLFKRQSNIKKLSLKGYSHVNSFQYKIAKPETMVPDDIFDNLKLESLEWRQNAYNSNVDAILAKQTRLESLELLDDRVTENVMNVVVSQLSELKTFSVNVADTSVSAFENIKKLKNLKDLTLRSNEERSMAPFEKFAKLDNSRISTLDLRYIIDMPVDLVQALAKSVPNLKVLRFSCDSDYQTFNAVMRNFNFIEVLKFDPFFTYFDHYQQNDIHNHLMQEGGFNPNLIELNISYTFPYKRPLLKKLIADYPNLKKLVLQSLYPLTSSQFKLILNGLPRMESLTLVSGASKLTEDDLDCIKEHRKTLKFIYLEDLNVKITARLKKKLSAMFDVVNVFYGLIMAVDRKTLNAERQ